MVVERDWSTQQVATLIGSIGAVTLVPGAFWAAAAAQSASYSDVPDDYWAQPFIQQLSQAEILAGYPDGTFQPEQPMDRDEYAAVIWQAFDQPVERSLADVSEFTDVPESYWADSAIAEAYEMGFMDVPAPNEFNPRTNISRAEAIVALVEGLDLQSSDASVAAVPAAAETVQPVRQNQGMPNQLAFPLASTTLMRLFAPPAMASSPQTPDSPSQTTAADTANDIRLDEYYADADQIPPEASEAVAIATQAGLVVNYPDPNLLNPNAPITRGSTAALIHQALVYQNQLEPLPDNRAVSQYTVEP